MHNSDQMSKNLPAQTKCHQYELFYRFPNFSRMAAKFFRSAEEWFELLCRCRRSIPWTLSFLCHSRQRNGACSPTKWSLFELHLPSFVPTFRCAANTRSQFEFLRTKRVSITYFEVLMKKIRSHCWFTKPSLKSQPGIKFVNLNWKETLLFGLLRTNVRNPTHIDRTSCWGRVPLSASSSFSFAVFRSPLCV